MVKVADLFARGVAFHQANRFEEAEAAYKNVIAADPRHFNALGFLGAILVQRGDNAEAVLRLRRSLQINPSQPLALINFGCALQNLKQYDEALQTFDKAVAINPRFTEAHNNRGTVLEALGRYSEALASYDQALALAPNYANAHYNRAGVLFKNLGRYQDALESYDRAIALNPGHAEAYANRGAVLREFDRYSEALADYDRAVALKPTHVESLNSRGVVLQDMRLYGDALASFESALTVAPDFAEAQWNKSLLKILRGEFEEGWRLYESRWETVALRTRKRHFPQPLWLGQEDIAQKTILLHAEQGMGDTIHFCRYARMVKARGATVVIEAPEALRDLVSTLDESIQVVASGQPLPNFDYHCPFMSLPLAFNTTLATIPAEAPYLAANEAKRARWQARLGPRMHPRVGLVWSGGRAHKNDRNRSIPLETMLPLLSLPVEFHCLQKEVREADRAILESQARIAIHDGDLHDFTDTAALISGMDLVISVDTAIAHLAGAMGKELWVLVPHAPDFRWMTERTDSPWYPTARLFRQNDPGNWPPVVRDIVAALRESLAARTHV